MKDRSAVSRRRVSTSDFYRSLEFDLADAVLTKLKAELGEMTPVPLEPRFLKTLEDYQGVYELYYKGERVYVGKTDSSAGLKRRLSRHAKKIGGRQNISPKDVSFKAIRIYVFTPLDLEEGLIARYKDDKQPLKWNKSGFGSNDPGRRRDGTRLKEGHFDLLYPVNLDLPLGLEAEFSGKVSELVERIRECIDYTVRCESLKPRSRKPHEDLEAAVVKVGLNTTVRQAFQNIAIILGKEWLISAFPGYVTVYKTREQHEHAEVIR